MSKNLSAVLVATRIQRRLKTPVPMLPFGEKTVLRQTLDTYLQAGFEEIVVVLGYRGSEIQESLGSLPESVRFVHSSDPEESFDSMAKRGIQALGSPKGVALGLGDQVLLSGDLLQRLAGAFSDSKAGILIPTWGDQIGLPVFLKPALAEEYSKAPAGTQMWDLLKAHGDKVEEYPTGHQSVLQHIADLEDYHKRLEAAGHPLPEQAGHGEKTAVPQQADTDGQPQD